MMTPATGTKEQTNTMALRATTLPTCSTSIPRSVRAVLRRAMVLCAFRARWKM